jgi:hypothetical protein
MEEPREQFTVVFALIVTKPASECVYVCVCVWRGRAAKTTVLCSPDSSRLIVRRKLFENIEGKEGIVSQGPTE